MPLASLIDFLALAAIWGSSFLFMRLAVVEFGPVPMAVSHCGRNQTQNENEAQRAIGAATIALFSNEGREVQLSGSGGTVTLTRR